jgi:hypothetical protein
VTKVAIPTDAAGLEELLNDSKRMADVWAQPDDFKEFISNYAKASAKKDPSVGNQVKEIVQAEFASFLKEHRELWDMKPQGGAKLDLSSGRPEITGAMARRAGTAYSRTAPGVALDGSVDNMAQFSAAIWHNQRNSEHLARAEKMLTILNSMSESVPSDGGFLVPEALRSELLTVSLEGALVRPG